MPQVQDTPATHDFYFRIHKALRLNLSRLLAALGSADPDDERALCDLSAQMREQMLLSISHLQHEEAVIHRALNTVLPAVVAELEADHRHHHSRFEEMAQLILEVRLEPAGARAAPMRQLYLAFSRFVAEDLAHMAKEEMETLPLLQSVFTDAELIAMEEEIVASVGPDEMALTARLMMAACRPAERLEMARHARETMPGEVFEAMLADVLTAMAPQDGERLLREMSVVLPLEPLLDRAA